MTSHTPRTCAMPGPRAQTLAALLVPMLALSSGLLSLCGCSPTATIERVDAPPVEAMVMAADESYVYVSETGGPIDAIPRDEIADVDHPGNVMALIGGIVVAATVPGVVALALDGLTLPAYAYAVIGVGGGGTAFAGGLLQWIGSTNAMAPTNGTIGLRLLPWVGPDNAGHGGLAVLWRFR